MSSLNQHWVRKKGKHVPKIAYKTLFDALAFLEGNPRLKEKYSVVWRECGQTDYRCRNFFTFLGACLYTYYLDHFKNVAPSIYESGEE